MESIFVGWLRRWRDKKPAASTPDLASLFLFFSLSLAAFPYISLFVPRFRPSRLTVFFSSLSPRRSLSRSFFLFPLRLFLCHRTAPVRPCLAPASLFIRHAQFPHLFFSLSPSFFLRLSCSRTQPPPSLFRQYFLSPFLFDVQTDRARERANEKIRTTWRTRKRAGAREWEREREREKVSEYRIHERAKTRRGRASVREREEERGTRGGMYQRRAMGYAAGGKRKRKERSGGC